MLRQAQHDTSDINILLSLCHDDWKYKKNSLKKTEN